MAREPEATVISSSLKFGVVPEVQPPVPEAAATPKAQEVDNFATMATYVGDANGWYDSTAIGGDDGSWHGRGYNRAFETARSISIWCGQPVLQSLGAATVSVEDCDAALQKLRGFPALWVGLLLTIWCKEASGRAHKAMVKSVEILTERGEEEVIFAREWPDDDDSYWRDEPIDFGEPEADHEDWGDDRDLYDAHE